MLSTRIVVIQQIHYWLVHFDFDLTGHQSIFLNYLLLRLLSALVTHKSKRRILLFKAEGHHDEYTLHIYIIFISITKNKLFLKDKLLTQDLLHIVVSRAIPSLFVLYYYAWGHLKIRLCLKDVCGKWLPIWNTNFILNLRQTINS